jgi:hypothetical protein
MAYRTVKIKKYLDIIEEYIASEIISPGMLVELTPSATTIRKHATEGGNALAMFALEDELQGKAIEDDYAATDPVQVWVPVRGEIVYALIEDEQSIAIGDFLESNGAGFLQKYIADDFASDDDYTSHHMIVGQALAALDLSGLSAEGSSDSPTRAFLKIRIL